MNLHNYLYIFSLAFFFLLGCKPVFDHQITVSELEESIGFLASDSLKGRLPGTPEDAILISYLSEKMDQSGLVPMEEDGLQPVEIESGFSITSNNSLKASDSFLLQVDGSSFVVFGFSATDTLEGELLLSRSVPQNWESTAENQILMLPLPDSIPGNDYDAFNMLRSAALHISDMGVAGIIFLSDDPLAEISYPKRLPLSIPVTAVHKSALTQLTGNEILSVMNSKERGATSSPLETGINVRLETEVIPTKITTYNTLFRLKGSAPELSNEYVVIGAHHDHLGMGGRGSSSRQQDTVAVHYGADDNASGVAGVLELGQYMISRSPSRSFVFSTFAAEEMGLHGSKALAASSIIPMENIQTMINLDMIGRLNEERQLQIGGVGTSPVFRPLIDSINSEYNFTIAYSEAGYGPSDHSSFYAKDVPVLFISTGAHTDYHTPADDASKIHYSGLEEVLYFVSDIAYALANYESKIPFTLAGPKESSGSRGRRGMVTFGLMPDMMYDGNEGMPVSFVTEGKPAAIGGMKGGDIITAVDGKHVGNVYDYMDRLSALKEGQSVVVSVKREGKQIELLLKL